MADFINARVIQKIATVSEWSTSTILPYKGEIMLVSDNTGKVVNIKVGDGINHFNDLPYMFENMSNFTVSDAGDVSVEGRTNGQILSWNAAINKWVARNEQSLAGYATQAWVMSIGFLTEDDVDTLQTVTDRGNSTTLDISVRGLRVSDFIEAPTSPPDPEDVEVGKKYFWIS